MPFGYLVLPRDMTEMVRLKFVTHSCVRKTCMQMHVCMSESERDRATQV